LKKSIDVVGTIELVYGVLFLKKEEITYADKMP